ncbi:DUF1588 domain-containing protein [Sorangium sp. So ce302]|uniref:DUF1588 domain-containing protein n=1 Tax=Sorangium sp. So ce302 TaxID=3133297 RepID=UPI003F60FA5A
MSRDNFLKQWAPRTALISALLLPAGCTGTSASPEGRGGGDGGQIDPLAAAPAQFSCDTAAVPAELPLPRLSRTQLQGTLQFAIELAAPTEAAAIWNEVSATFAQYPADSVTPAPGDLRGGYARTDQGIQQTQIDAMYTTGVAIGQQLTSTDARMAAMLGACATDSSTTNDRTCLESFIGTWGSRVLRYALSQADVTFYADIAGDTPVDKAAVADVIAALLNAPQTLYRVEHGTDDAAAAVSPLSAYELASRLSLEYWQVPPDDALWAAAADGSLLNDATYEAQLERLVKSPSSQSSLDEFVTQWLRLDELPRLDALNADPKFKAFAGAQLPTSTARDAFIADVLASARATVGGGQSVSDFLNDKHAYATDDYLAGIYQVPTWTGSGEAPLFGSSERVGLLTRAALLATGTVTTRPIHKGYLVRNALLCQQLGAPPASANTQPPTSTASMTTRESVTERTAGGVCGGCHTNIINPPGFITENFDALGRERTEEQVFDATGALLTSLPVDTLSVPQVQIGDSREMSDAAELTRAIDDSRLFHSCLARQYFRFSQSRIEAPAQDGCLLEALESKARSGASFADVLKTPAQFTTFKARRF